MGNAPTKICTFDPEPRQATICAKCQAPRSLHTKCAIAYPCSVVKCNCKRFSGVDALCMGCSHPLCLHIDPETSEVVPDPPLPLSSRKWDLTKRLTSGYSQVNLFGQNLEDEEEMKKLGRLLAAPGQCVKALWLNGTNLQRNSLSQIARWLPAASSLRELYLLSNKEVGSQGTIDLFQALPHCQLTALHCDYTLANTLPNNSLTPEDIAAMITAIQRNRKLQYLSLNLPEKLTIEQQLALSEAIKSNRTITNLYIFMSPRECTERLNPPRLVEPYSSIVGLRLVLNRSRGLYIPHMLAFLLGTSPKLGGEDNQSPIKAMARDALWDRNVAYLVFQFAFG